MTTETQTLPKLDKSLQVQESRITYQGVGTATQKPFSAIYSEQLRGTPNMSYYQVIEQQMPQDYTMTSAGFERVVQRAIEEARQDPRKASVFNDLFARNEGQKYMWQWTTTGLRVPKGWEDGSYDQGIFEATGKIKYPRIVLEGDRKVAELLVPRGNGRVITSWFEEFGIPSETEDIAWPHKPYNSHFWLESNPSVDNYSGHKDVAVQRRSDWLHVESEGCLGVGAVCTRSNSNSYGGFRPVGKSIIVPEFEKFILDEGSYQKGIEAGRQLERQEITRELKALLEKYKQ